MRTSAFIQVTGSPAVPRLPQGSSSRRPQRPGHPLRDRRALWNAVFEHGSYSGAIQLVYRGVCVRRARGGPVALAAQGLGQGTFGTRLCRPCGAVQAITGDEGALRHSVCCMSPVVCLRDGNRAAHNFWHVEQRDAAQSLHTMAQNAADCVLSV